MDFPQRKKLSSNEERYHIENLKAAREFSKVLLQEMGELVRSLVLFGSNTHDTLRKDSDVDIMVVLDNVSVYVSPELREAYRVIVENLSTSSPKKLHILTVNLSDLWDMSRKGDPVLINILRFGMPIFDRDLIEPLQYLLEIGKMKPTREAVTNYTARAQTLLEETHKHLQEALLDLYYAVIDATHALLMTQKVMPPSPKEMPKLFKEIFAKKKTLLKFSADIEEFYKLAKQIEHGKAPALTGTLYDTMNKKAMILIAKFRDETQKELLKKDNFEL